MDEQDQQHTTADDLTATVPEGGPNSPHVNEYEPTEEQVEAALAEEQAMTEGAVAAAEEESEWAGHDAPSAENGSTAAPTPPQSEPLAPSEPTPEPQPTSTEAVSPPGDAAPTGEADGGPSEPQEASSEPQEATRSGDQQRPYVILEEQDVIPLHVLTDKLTEAQAKKLAGTTPVKGYVVATDAIIARNGEHAMEQSYANEPPGEHVTGLLPLSKRNFRPVEPDAKVETKTTLKFRRR